MQQIPQCRLNTLTELAASTAVLKDVDQACERVLATLQQHTGSVCVVAAVPKPNAKHPEQSSIVIYLNKAVTKSVPVGWFIVN